MEQWRPVVGFSEAYEVSDHGRVRRLAGFYANDSLARRIRPHILATTNAQPGKYPMVNLLKDGRLHKRLVHRLVAAAFIGECPPGHEHNHKNGNTTDNRPSNLEFMTHRQNMRHAFDVLKREATNKGGHINQGSAHGAAKLNETIVATIRARRERGETCTAIAKDIGVAIPTISMIVRGKTWRHTL